MMRLQIHHVVGKKIVEDMKYLSLESRVLFLRAPKIWAPRRPAPAKMKMKTPKGKIQNTRTKEAHHTSTKPKIQICVRY
jgi:hypothetical protein